MAGSLPGLPPAAALGEGDQESTLNKRTLKKKRKWSISCARIFSCVDDPTVSRFGMGMQDAAEKRGC